MTNLEIVNHYMNDDKGENLIKKCVDIQFQKLPYTDAWKQQFKEDYYHDLILELLDYDKLEKTHNEKHMNALITRIILNNLYSDSSRFYCKYLRPMMKSNEMKDKYIVTVDDNIWLQ